jgi:hypothetical protein
VARLVRAGPLVPGPQQPQAQALVQAQQLLVPV